MTIKRTLYGLMILLLVAIVAIVGAAAWLNSQTTLWGGASEFIAQEIEALSDDLDIEVGGVAIKWSGWQQRTVLEISDMALHGRKQGVSAYLTDIVLDIDSLALLLHQELVIRNLSVGSAKVALRLGQGDAPNEPLDIKSISKKLARYVESSRLPLHEIELAKLSVVRVEEDAETMWLVKNVALSLTNPMGVLEANGGFDIDHEGQHSRMMFNAQVEQTGRIILHNSWQRVTPKLLASFVPQIDWLQDAPIVVDMVVETAIDGNGDMEETTFSIYTNKNLMQTSRNETITAARQIVMRGRLQMDYSQQHQRWLPEIWLNGDAYNFPVADIGHYWPPKFAVGPRKWVLERLLDGVGKHATVRMHIKPQDIINRHVSKGGLDIVVQYDDARLKYFDILPELKNASGTVRFDWNNLYATADYATVGDVIFTDSAFTINHMKPIDSLQETRFIVAGDVAGGAQDVLAFFMLQQAEAEKSLFDQHAVSGTAAGDFSLSFPLRKQLSLDDMLLSSDIDFRDIEIANMWQDKPAKAELIHLKGEGMEVLLSGDMMLQDTLFAVEYRQQLTMDSQRPRFVQLATAMASEQLSEYINFPQLAGYFEGDIQLETALDIYPDKIDIALTIGAEQLLVDVPLIVQQLKTKHDILLDAQMQWRHDPAELTINSAMLNVGEQRMEASGVIAPKTNEIYVDIHKAISPFSDMSLTYERDVAGATMITSSGKKLDIASLLAWFDGGQHGVPLWKQDMNIRVVMDEVQLLADVPMHDVRFELDCTTRYCERISLTGEIGDAAPVYIMFEPLDDDNPAGINTFEVIASDAGSLFRGFGISDSLRDGQLMVNAVGSFDQPAHGRATLSDFRIVDAPVLGRLFTLGSFAAVGDLLSGKGMKFDDLEADFTYRLGQISLKKFRATGAAMGVTSHGFINLEEDKIELNGSLIPSYRLNTLMSKIPIVGRVFSGGDDGLLASRYSVEGKMSDPEISVNPFSMLTPGVLRNLWGD